jgi:hypothetical protein
MASEDEIKIVLERLKVMPRTVKLNIGSYGSFSRDQLIEEIINKTEVGELVVKMQILYIKSFRERAKK